MSAMNPGSLLLAAAFVAATLIGSRLPDEVQLEGATLASAAAEECKPSPEADKSSIARVCDADVVVV